MSRPRRYDAVVVGAGPNGLAAAITLAREGRSVLVREAASRVGGGVRSAELTLQGFVHDVCSAVYPLGVSSPFLRTLPLREHGLEWVEPPLALAHPFDGGEPALLHRSIDETARTLAGDAAAYRSLFEPVASAWRELATDVLAPPGIPRHPLHMARFGLHGLRSATRLARARFATPRARAFFAGLAAHSMVPLERAATAAFGLVLGTLGHTAGWPFARGGSQSLADALAEHLRLSGGDLELDAPVRALSELPATDTVLLDLTPVQVIRVAGDLLPSRYRRALERFGYGPGAYKMDWALSGPVPWRNPACAAAGTVHLGGSLEEIAAAERAAWEGRTPERPFVIAAQPSLFDPSRAPAGRHTLWGYCHVPNGSIVDMSDRIEAQVERFAPGFRDLILARHAMGPRELEAHNANLVGGDIGGGANTLGQLFFRPVMRLVPCRTPVRGLYLCSSSTPPGGGVHGMCGHHAARVALRDRATFRL